MQVAPNVQQSDWNGMDVPAPPTPIYYRGRRLSDVCIGVVNLAHPGSNTPLILMALSDAHGVTTPCSLVSSRGMCSSLWKVQMLKLMTLSDAHGVTMPCSLVSSRGMCDSLCNVRFILGWKSWNEVEFMGFIVG